MLRYNIFKKQEMIHILKRFFKKNQKTNYLEARCVNGAIINVAIRNDTLFITEHDWNTGGKERIESLPFYREMKIEILK